MSAKAKKIAVFISGGGSNLQALIDAGCNIKLAVSSNPEALGLKRAKARTTYAGNWRTQRFPHQHGGTGKRDCATM